MQQIIFRGQKIFLIWLILLFFISGCAAQQESPVVTSTQFIVQTDPAPPKFGVGDIASIARKDVEKLSDEEILKMLVSQWLEGYKGNASSEEGIVDYKIEEIFPQNNPNDPGSRILAIVTFAVQPIEYSQNWASIVGKTSEEGDPWWHVGATFSVVPDGEYFRLRILFGYGT